MIKRLIRELNAASKAYYNDQAIMSDKEWDEKFDKLKALEERTGKIYQNSPTQSPGYEVIDGFNKKELIYPMLSLQKTKLVSDIENFLNGGKSYIISDKLDGSSCEIVYENCVLVSATTRGNGKIGEDITHNAKTFLNLPKRIEFEERFVLRCELVISYKNFENFKDEYKNPRNLVGGSIRQLDSSICAERFVEAIVIDPVETPFENDYKSDDFDSLETMGFTCVDRIIRYVDLEYDLNNVDIEYPTDGKVVTFDFKEYANSLDSTSHHPKHSIAFKWKDETHTTTFKHIDWNVSRTGTITPVAVFEPTEIEGSTVERASCHNVSELKKLNLAIYDEIEVYKANMIIPQIHCNNTEHNVDITYIPTECPICDGQTEIRNEHGTETLVCTNEKCLSKVVGSISHFCDVMNMKGISDKIIEKIVRNNSFISNVSDLFLIRECHLINVDGFKEKSINNIVSTIRNNKTCTLAQFLRSLGLKHVGHSVSELIAKEFYNYFNHTRTIDWYELSDTIIDLISDNKIEGIGSVMFEDIKDEMLFNVDNFNEIFNYVTIEDQVIKETIESSISGKSFCISGKTELGKKKIYDLIEENGGKCEKSVTKRLDFLISNETGTSKVKKAEKNGTTILTEESFLLKLN